MVKYKDTEKKVNLPKRSITISDVKIVGNELVDEEGSIVKRLLDTLPDGEETTFTVKISIELPSEEDSKNE